MPQTSPAAPPSYVRYFGLREAPFSPASDRRFVFLGASHTKALAHLLHGIEQPGAILHLTGDIGSGKTTVCRLLLDRLPQDVDGALIPDPTLLAESLDRHLRAARVHKRRTVLIVDDAQRLGADSLDQFRAPQEFLRLILSGRSELIDFLGLEILHRLSRVVSAGYHLLPLAEAETSAYVRHRLALAGGGRDIFERGALPEVHRLSGGMPRLINTICARALLDAHARRRTTVDLPTVRTAAHQEFPETVESVVPEPPKAPVKRRPLWPWLAIAGIVATALVVAAIFIIMRFPGSVIVAPRGPAERDHYPAPSPSADPAPPAQARPSRPGIAVRPEPPVATGTGSAQQDAGEEPAVRIDLLVWASDPKERMVYVNGRKYVEGDTMEDGAVIERIVQDGVVLLRRDQRRLIRSESPRAAPAEDAR